MTVFIETKQIQEMVAHEHYARTRDEKKQTKYNLLDKIKVSLGDKWTRLKEGTRQTFDMICFLGSELGFYYAGNEYLAAKHGISERTLRYRLSELIDLGQVVKIHKRAKNCNGKGKPVYLFTNHPYFSHWVEFLGLDLSNCHTDCHTENDETPCGSRAEALKKNNTYLRPIKQELNNNISDINNNKIMKYIYNRVMDSTKEGSTISYLSSFVDKVFRTEERKALYEEVRRQDTIRRKKVEEARKFFNPVKDFPLYNWLED